MSLAKRLREYLLEKKSKDKITIKQQDLDLVIERITQPDTMSENTTNLDFDLDKLTIKDYEEIEITEEEKEKFEGLKKPIEKIQNQNKSDAKTEYEKSKKYKIDYKNRLNSRQFNAVTTISGPILVIAGAGSGKTRILVHRVAYLIENNTDPKNILLLTFTRKAANEMLSRVQELLNDKSGNQVMGGTFHSFANYALRKYHKILNIQPNFTIIDSDDAADIIDLLKSELGLDKSKKSFPRKTLIQKIISSARNKGLTIRQVIENDKDHAIIDEHIEAIELLNEGYTRYKLNSNIFDYDDLMEVLRDELRDNQKFRDIIQQQYKYIMVDEFQDTNLIQKEIVDSIAAHHQNIMVVGDDTQSIYSFRGANYENILKFPETYPNAKIIKVEENYRSNQGILNFTNSIIEAFYIGYKKTLHSSNKFNWKPIINKFYLQNDEAEYIISKILELKESKGIDLNDIAILYRATWHGNYIQTELLKRNIPYIVVGGIKFVERRHIKDILAYLKLLQNPYDAVAWHRVLKLIQGIGKITASKIAGIIKKNKGKIDFQVLSSKKYYEELNKLQKILNKASPDNISVSKKIEIIKSYYAPILKNLESDHSVRITDINVLIDMAKKYSNVEKFLTDFVLEPPNREFQDKNVPLTADTDEKPLTLSTIHSAKGLEWYTVFIPHALEGLLPSSRAHNIQELEEERRLFYVACSRAKEQLYITMPSYVYSYGGTFSYPSRFIIEIRKKLYDFRQI